MYDSEDQDIVVKYYNQAFGVGSEYEMKWYLKQVEYYGGPVLDLACGNGFYH